MSRVNVLFLTAPLFALISGSAFAGNEGWFSGPKTDLVVAHEAYLERDFVKMADAIRSTLEHTRDPHQRENALALIEKAYEAGSGRIDVDWSPPRGVAKLELTQGRKAHPDRVFYMVQLRGRIETPDTLTELSIRDERGRVVLDKDARDASWEVGKEDDGGLGFDLKSPEMDAPLPEGIYYLRIQSKADPQRTTGWFVLTHHVASRSPEVSAPKIGEVFSHGHPEIAWRDFRSPQFKRFESRNILIFVAQLYRPGWTARWSLYGHDPDFTNAVVGREPMGSGASELEDGRYWLSVIFHESRHFGPLKIRRASVRAQGFEVRH